MHSFRLVENLDSADENLKHCNLSEAQNSADVMKGRPSQLPMAVKLQKEMKFCSNLDLN